jgi:hypothetical protein
MSWACWWKNDLNHTPPTYPLLLCCILLLPARNWVILSLCLYWSREGVNTKQQTLSEKSWGFPLCCHCQFPILLCLPQDMHVGCIPCPKPQRDIPLPHLPCLANSRQVSLRQFLGTCASHVLDMPWCTERWFTLVRSLCCFSLSANQRVFQVHCSAMIIVPPPHTHKHTGGRTSRHTLIINIGHLCWRTYTRWQTH